MVKNKLKRICVFCSSSNVVDEVYFKAAAELGSEIVKKGYGLVYGGSSLGLMKILAKTVKSAGGTVLGVLPFSMKSRKPDNTLVSKLIYCKDLRQRKKIMEKKSDAIIVLPGGYGTLDEVLEMITLKVLDFSNKPIVFLNINGFFDSLFVFIKEFTEKGFANKEKENLFLTANTAEEALRMINSAH